MKKTFKHRKTGDKVTLETGVYVYNSPTIKYILPPDIVENSYDWEEIKGYEIWRSNGETIYAVKRLSDNEIFYLGEKVTYSERYNGPFKINKFQEKDGKLYVHSESNCECNIDSLITIKKDIPILTTEDGVDIYNKEQTIYAVFFNKYTASLLAADIKAKYFNSYTTHKLFSTQEEANKYILYNQPILSLNEILSAGWNRVEEEGERTPLFQRILKAAKEKSKL